MKGIILGSAAALVVVLVTAAGFAITKLNGPASGSERVLSVSDVAGVPYGSTANDTRQGLRQLLQSSQTADWVEAPHLGACGFSQEQLIVWDRFEATFARKSPDEMGILVAVMSSRSDIAATSGVTVGQTIDEVQQLGGFLAYVDGPIIGDGVEFAAVAPIGVDIIQIAQFDTGVVDAIVTGIPCVVGLEPPSIPNITTTTSTTTTSTTTTTRPATPEWEVGWCVADRGAFVEPVDCSSPRADYRILAVVSTESRCPQTAEYYTDLDDGSVACFG